MFDSAMRTANKGFKTEALQMVQKWYTQLPDASVADKYRYYSFMFDFYHSYYSIAKNLDSALLYSDSMQLVIENGGMTKQMAAGYAKAYEGRAEIYMEQAKYPEAIRAVSGARLIAETSGDSCSMAEYNSTIALAMYRQAKYLEAATYYKLSLAASYTCPDTSLTYERVQSWYDNLGLAYTMANMPDSAIVYYDKAAEYLITKKDLHSTNPTFTTIAMGVVYGQKAQALQQKGDYKGAEKLYKRSIAINIQKGYDNQFAANMKLHLAQLYLEVNRPDTALQLLDEVKGTTVDNSSQGLEIQLNWYKAMWLYNAAKNNATQINRYLNRYLQFDDSLKTLRRGLVETNAKTVFSHMQLDYETTLIKKDNILKRNYLIALVLSILIVVGIALTIRRNWMGARKFALELSKLNDEIKENGVRLELLLDQLELKNREKDRIMRIVAHDLRNPLSSINILISSFDEGSEEEKKRFLQIIQLACSDSLGLVNEILAVYTGNSDQPPNKQPTDINLLVTECIELMQITAAKKKQHLVAELLAEKKCILVDAEKIRRVINNLISNAAKFSGEGKEIKILIEEKPQSFVLAVKDEGIGIPVKNQGKVFDLFTTARRSGTKGETSYGLGLSICKQIMDAHGGNICFTSEQNKGTTFYLEFKKE